MDWRQRLSRQDLNRHLLLRALVLGGVATFLITELLSAFTALSRGPLIACWTVVLAGAALYLWRNPASPRLPRPDYFVLAAVAGVCATLILTAIAAIYSPPNSADAMAYHMPRVIYWAEQSSIRFFPTPYLNQIMLQPLAEYFMLHSYLLAGNDHWINLVQWFASAGCALAVSSIAKEFGATARGQALAAVFCATIPPGILAASGAKNDYVLALCLALAVYFALRFSSSATLTDAGFLGASIGLAMLTKGTAYVFAPWPLAVILLWQFRRALLPGAAVAFTSAVAINIPHYTRNYELSGSPLGFDSAHGNGFFRWQNETFGWRQTTSNVARNISEQLGGRSEKWNQGVYDRVAAFHRTIGIGLNDPDTTWRWIEFRPPRNANHEADAPARWHLLLPVLLFWIWGLRYPKTALYAASLAFGFLLFCAYLKWQPFMARLFLPLFVLSSPLIGLWVPPKLWLQVPLYLFLLNNARPSLFENWVRPLKGPRNIFVRPRDDQYFADMVQFDDRAAYRPIVEQVVQSGCGVVGIDINDFQLEYPLMALLRERNPAVLFVHTSVRNPSARYQPPVTMHPCAIVCIRCGQGPKVQFDPPLYN